MASIDEHCADPMNFTHVRAFHLVARAGSFSLAARTESVSQPTLSAQVKSLEGSYGVALFDRRGRGIELTPTGRSLFAVTTRLFAAEEEARAVLAGSRELTRGHLRVSADSAYHVMPILAALRQRHAGVTFSLKVDNSAVVLSHLLEHRADVAVMAKSTSDPRIYTSRLRSDTLVLFVPHDHPLGRRRSIRLADLAGRDLVVRERGSITREVLESRLAESATVPGSLTDVQTREAVREAVAAGFGIGVVFESEFGTDARFHRIAVSDADLSVSEYVVCLEERRRISLVRAFLDIAAGLSAAPARQRAS